MRTITSRSFALHSSGQTRRTRSIPSWPTPPKNSAVSSPAPTTSLAPRRPPFDLTPEELAAILPNLIKSGSAGIVWHRVKPFREKYGAMAYALEAATDAQIAHNQRVEEAVVECVTRLASKWFVSF
jgi:hypothetical protein